MDAEKKGDGQIAQGDAAFYEGIAEAS